MTGVLEEPPPHDHPVVAVLGMGEAGYRFCTDLVESGVVARGYDPVVSHPPRGVSRAASVTEAVRDADIVLAVVPASQIVSLGREAAGALAPGAIYADCAAGRAADKREAAEFVAEAGGDFVDVAILGVVPATGLRTPSLLSGPGASRLAGFLRSLGMPASVVSDDPGVATEHKLLRSVFMKGFAAAVGEALDAAERLGSVEWLRDQIDEELRRAGASLVDRFQDGTRRHAARRVAEMSAALDLLDEVGLPAEITRATIARLTRLAAEDAAHPHVDTPRPVDNPGSGS